MDQTGKRFGFWKVLSFSTWDEKHYNHKWKCLCIGCGLITDVIKSNLTLNKSKGCLSCCVKDSKNGNWKGSKDIPSEVLYRVRHGAKKRNIIVDIQLEDLQDIWEDCNGMCSISGIPIQIGTSASVDRIDSDKGYTKENIQWTHKDINMMKRDLDESYFKELCSYVHNNIGK